MGTLPTAWASLVLVFVSMLSLPTSLLVSLVLLALSFSLAIYTLVIHRKHGGSRTTFVVPSIALVWFGFMLFEIMGSSGFCLRMAFTLSVLLTIYLIAFYQIPRRTRTKLVVPIFILILMRFVGFELYDSSTVATRVFFLLAILLSVYILAFQQKYGKTRATLVAPTVALALVALGFFMFTSPTPYISISQLAEQGDADAQYTLGISYDFGLGELLPADQAEAVKWYRKAAEQGHAEAQLQLGIHYGEEDFADQAEAVKWYRKAAEQGHAEAQFRLGICYFMGLGVEKNEAEAVTWYRKAAEQGEAAAQYMFGLCYFNGYGVSVDKTESIKWFRKAAEQGLATAQYMLGEGYAFGDGMPVSEKKALKWFRKAAEQGDADAQYMVGIFYYEGRGVSINRDEGVQWLRKAAEQGHADALDFLSR